MTSLDEKKTTGASYIFSFYIEIQNLTDTYSNYVNLMLELEYKYKNNIEKAEESDKNIVNQWLQMVRKSCHKCYIQYKTILPTLKIEENDKLNEKYLKISNCFVIDRNDLKDFVLSMNKVLVNGIIQELLVDNQDFIKDIYKKD